jgi:hypothetical protein
MPSHAPPHAIRYAANQFPAGPYAQQFTRPDLQGPFDNAHPQQGCPQQGPQQGWNTVTGPAPPHDAGRQPRAEQLNPATTRPQHQSVTRPQHQFVRNDSHVPGPSRNPPPRDANSGSRGSPRIQRDTRGEGRRRIGAIETSRHATPPRRERLRDAVGRSSNYRAQLRAPSPRLDNDQRLARSNRSSDNSRQE